MKNKLTDLNNHLFAQLERLGDEELTGEKLTEEIHRAKVIANIAQQIVNSGNLVLSAIKTKEEYFPAQKALPEMFSAEGAGEQAKERKLPATLKDGCD